MLKYPKSVLLTLSLADLESERKSLSVFLRIIFDFFVFIGTFNTLLRHSGGRQEKNESLPVVLQCDSKPFTYVCLPVYL